MKLLFRKLDEKYVFKKLNDVKDKRFQHTLSLLSQDDDIFMLLPTEVVERLDELSIRIFITIWIKISRGTDAAACLESKSWTFFPEDFMAGESINWYIKFPQTRHEEVTKSPLKKSSGLLASCVYTSISCGFFSKRHTSWLPEVRPCKISLQVRKKKHGLERNWPTYFSQFLVRNLKQHSLKTSIGFPKK